MPVLFPDGRHFSLRYLTKLSTLPGIEYLPDSSEPGGNFAPMMVFRFDGGIGVLMPMRA